MQPPLLQHTDLDHSSQVAVGVDLIEAASWAATSSTDMQAGATRLMEVVVATPTPLRPARMPSRRFIV